MMLICCIIYFGESKKLGDLVVLAVPYVAFDGILDTYKDELAGRITIDITNPVNFETFDCLVGF
ncbi:hypothetical protein [Bavariicoccus seileri]|uniref:hypothetical protein n=1 Tax=Bavariicoccus seileri TaxID=549685 RepID=UPI00047E8749